MGLRWFSALLRNESTRPALTASDEGARRAGYHSRRYRSPPGRKAGKVRTPLRPICPAENRIGLTGPIRRVYDSTMTVARRVRPFVCLLLAVSTAIGAAVPARACACVAPATTSSAPTGERAKHPIPAAKSCCQPTASKRSCCGPTSNGGTSKASCCGGKAPAERPEKSPAAPTSTDTTGCHCLRCDCDTASAPPAPTTPAPASSVTDLDEHAAVSPVPPDFVPGTPAAASRAVRSLPVAPPTDLVISLSRLTC